MRFLARRWQGSGPGWHEPRMTAFWRAIATVLVLLGGVEMGRGVELTVSRQALERTLMLKISIHLCRGCSFAKEPQGFERLAGMTEETRRRFIGDIHAGAVSPNFVTR